MEVKRRRSRGSSSGGWQVGHEGLADHPLVTGFPKVAARFAAGEEITAHPGKDLRAKQGAETARDLLLHLNPADVLPAWGVGEGHVGINQKGQHASDARRRRVKTEEGGALPALGLIGFDHPEVIGLFFFDPVSGGCGLSMHGIGGDQSAAQVQILDEFFETGNLVGFGRDGDWAAEQLRLVQSLGELADKKMFEFPRRFALRGIFSRLFEDDSTRPQK